MATRWARLDVDYFRNPKALAAGPKGRALHIASICYAAGQLTDGVVPREALQGLLLDAQVPRSTMSLLCEVGLWIPNGTGYVIHDYGDHQPTRARVEEEREQWRERQRKARARQAGVTGDSPP